MTVIDFHPEDLLEREGSGTLSATQQRRLNEHVARCASCRIERQLRLDFERELGPQAAPDILPALVAGALRAAGDTRRLSALEPAPRARRSRRPLAVLLAAGVVLGASLAAARPDAALRAFDFASEQLKALLGHNSPPRATSAATAPTSHDEPSAAPLPAARENTSLQAAQPADATPESQLRERPGSTGAPRAVQERRRARTLVQPLPQKGALPAATAADPATLFDRANAARRGGSGAEALYQELQARFPESPEARLSQVILGRMQLDSGAAAAALSQFEAYLATGERALREPAMAGCALAWAKLGRSDRERQSWRALLAAYPESSYAPLARQRLIGEAP